MTHIKLDNHTIDLTIKKLVDLGHDDMAAILSGLNIKMLGMEKALNESVRLIKKQEVDFHTMTVEMRSANILRAVDACGPDCHLRKSLTKSMDRPSTTAYKDQLKSEPERPDNLPGSRMSPPKKWDEWKDLETGIVWIFNGVKWIPKTELPISGRGGGGPE